MKQSVCCKFVSMYSHVNLYFQSCVSTTSAVSYCNVVNSETKHFCHAWISWNNLVRNKTNSWQHLNVTTIINNQNYTKTPSAITLQKNRVCTTMFSLFFLLLNSTHMYNIANKKSLQQMCYRMFYLYMCLALSYNSTQYRIYFLWLVWVGYLFAYFLLQSLLPFSNPDLLYTSLVLTFYSIASVVS